MNWGGGSSGRELIPYNLNERPGKEEREDNGMSVYPNSWTKNSKDNQEPAKYLKRFRLTW